MASWQGKEKKTFCEYNTVEIMYSSWNIVSNENIYNLNIYSNLTTFIWNNKMDKKRYNTLSTNRCHKCVSVNFLYIHCRNIYLFFEQKFFYIYISIKSFPIKKQHLLQLVNTVIAIDIYVIVGKKICEIICALSNFTTFS